MQDTSESPSTVPIFTSPARKRSAIVALPSKSKARRPEPHDAPVTTAPAPIATPRDVDEAPDTTEESRDEAIQIPPTRTSTYVDTTPDHDRWVLAILDAPLLAGEPAAVGFARRERELRDAFAELPILAARALHKRLANPQRDDLLAEKFSRLTVERRNRLLQFLADARRRAAISIGRR